jgi:hypothetical protein
VGLPYELSVAGFDGRWHSEDLVPPGARDVELEVPDGAALRVRVVDARTGAVLRIDADVQLVAREEGGRFVVLPRPTVLSDAAGWVTFLTTARALELVALPRAASLPGLGTRSVHVRTDEAEPARAELVLERGAELELTRAAGADPWPADRELLLVEERLASAVDIPSPYQARPLDELFHQRRILFDAHGRARLVGLTPGAYRFKLLPEEPGWTITPEHVRVEPGMPPVVVQWEVR